LTLGSQIAAIGFAISGTVQEFLGSCIFLFVKHPFDVGDRVLIADHEMIVEHISLLYTTFRRVDNNRVVQISNIKNNDNTIENISRSDAMREEIQVSVSVETSACAIEELRAELKTFLVQHENKRDFYSDIEIEMLSVKDLKSLDLLISVTHKVGPKGS
jgi:small-conductance mechanosensitive channel